MKWCRPLSWIVVDDLVEIPVLAVALLRRRVRVRGRLPLASLPWRRPLRPIQIRVDGVLRVLRLSGSRRQSLSEATGGARAHSPTRVLPSPPSSSPRRLLRDSAPGVARDRETARGDVFGVLDLWAG